MKRGSAKVLIVLVWVGVIGVTAAAFAILKPFSGGGPGPTPNGGDGGDGGPQVTVNNPPTDISLDNTRVKENSPGATVGTLSVSDPDAGDSHELTVSDDRFEIRGTSLKLKSGQQLSVADGSTVPLTITAKDKAGATFDKRLTLTVEQSGGGSSAETDRLTVPFITWGGDVATFYANGDLKTQPGSIYDQLGLQLDLVNGDDFRGQVDSYKAGTSHFLRGTFSMLGEVSEELNKNADTQAVVILQLTWSAGDHMVARENIRNLSDLKGKMIAIQKSGPHVGMLDDTLWAAGLEWSEITPVWVDDLTGENGPAARFKSDSRIAACMVISPDMALLIGDYDKQKIGTGDDDTVKGAHVVNSTAWMTRSICDVYACRKSFYDANRDVVEKFVAGYLKGCEEVVQLKQDYDANKPANKYVETLKLAKTILGDEALPTLEDAHGLISDCKMVLLSGNQEFFTNDLYFNGFKDKQRKVIDSAIRLGLATERREFLRPNLDYDRIVSIGGLKPSREEKSGETKTSGTIFSFEIYFPENDDNFDPSKFTTEFQRAAELSALFGGAVIEVRGHVDPTKLLIDFFAAAEEEKLVRREGAQRINAETQSRIDPADTKTVIELTGKWNFKRRIDNPKETIKVANELSQKRAERVRMEVLKFARSKGIRLDDKQFLSEGVGVAEPKHPVPKSEAEQGENRRVEFRITKASAETSQVFGED